MTDDQRSHATTGAELELQREIDASLKRTYAPPEMPAGLLDRIREPNAVPLSAAGEEQGNGRGRLFAALAAVVAWIFVGWLVYNRSSDDGYQQLAMHDIYQQSVAAGFKPDWVCENDHEFASTFERRQGQALLLKPIPDGAMLGLAYLQALTRKTTAMLARVEGEPILVFVDRLERDTDIEKPSWRSGLQLFRKELAGLVLYEITPLSEPRVIDFFYPTEVDVEP